MKAISERENGWNLRGYTKAVAKPELTELFPDLVTHLTRSNRYKQNQGKPQKILKIKLSNGKDFEYCVVLHVLRSL